MDPCLCAHNWGLRLFCVYFPLLFSAVIVQFQPSSYIVNEDEGVVRFTIVKRTQTTQDVTVQFTTQDGSAT